MKNKNESTSAERLYKVFIYVALLTLAIVIIVPVAWVFMAAFKENSEFYGNPCVEYGEDGRIYAEFSNSDRFGADHFIGCGITGGLLPVKVQFPRT